MGDVKEMAEASSASTTKWNEEKVEMLDWLLTRLALCDDSNLQPLLSKLLPFTISSLSSQSSAVRNKGQVLEILSFSSKYIAIETMNSTWVFTSCLPVSVNGAL